jgi:ribosomal protein S18 acetylase RimI-like enzyme
MAPDTATLDAIRRVTPDLGLVSRIEAHAARAWPAREALPLGDWSLNVTPGSRSRRINSLTPVAREADLATVLPDAEAIWASRGLSRIVRVTPLASALTVDWLDRSGAPVEGLTVVQSLALDHERPLDRQVSLAAEPGADWASVTARDIAERDVIVDRLGEVGWPQVLASLKDPDGNPVAVGRAAAGDGLVGIFHVATRPECRGRGYASRIVESLLAWGRREGAALAYLQVEHANAAARAVYERAGFRDSYRYHYRALRL